MANRTPLRVFLSLSWLACHPLAFQLQASTPPGALVFVAGHAKCGTSHLHGLLASHRDVFVLGKERCPWNSGIDEASFAKYLSFTASRAQAKDGSWLRMNTEEVQAACVTQFGEKSADGCRTFYQRAKSGGSKHATKVLQSCITENHATSMQHIAPVANARVLFANRDPADLAWSAYNFWTKNYDAPATTPKEGPFWTSDLNYRTPGHFHELVASQGKLVGGIPNWGDFVETGYMRDLRDTFGRDQVLFLRAEDMHKRETVQKICDFVGLDIGGIKPELIDATTNSQGSLDDRGPGKTSDGKEEPGRYQVSNFEPMLCKTREMIYKQARDVCSQLAKEFGLHYPKCLGKEPACP